jgi:lysophospholipase L1-like esterase
VKVRQRFAVVSRSPVVRLSWLPLLAVAPGLVAVTGCGNATPQTRAIPPAAELVVESPQMERAPAPEVAIGAGAAAAAPSTPALAPPQRFLDHPEALARFFSALSDLEKGARADDVRVLQFGDSHTAADYQTGPLRRALQHRFGDGGRGFVSVGRPWKAYTQEGVQLNGMSGWAPERGRFAKGKFVGDGQYGLVGVSITTAQHGARAYSDLTAPASRLELAYLEAPRGGSVDLLVDGTRVQRVKTAAAEAKSAYASFEVPEGPHRVELAAVGDGSVRVFGVTLDRPKAGVVLDALGVNGARAGDLLRLSEEHFLGEVRHRDPSLVVLAYGTNESSDDVPMETYERQLVEVLGRVARAVPTASCLILGPPDRATKHRVVVPVDGAAGATTVQTVWTTLPRLVEVAEMERKVAAAAGCAYFSQLDVMGGPGSIAGWALEAPPRAMLDRTHLSRQGYTELGEAIAAELLRAYDAARPRVTAPPALAASLVP